MSFFSFAEKSIFAYVFILLIILNFATRKEKPREFYTPIFMSHQDIINKIDMIENWDFISIFILTIKLLLLWKNLQKAG